jgi:hypothetical protein
VWCAGGDAPEIELEDDEGGEGVPLSGLAGVPLIVSVGVLGGMCVVDPGTLEEKAAAAILHVAVSLSWGPWVSSWCWSCGGISRMVAVMP